MKWTPKRYAETIATWKWLKGDEDRPTMADGFNADQIVAITMWSHLMDAKHKYVMEVIAWKSAAEDAKKAARRWQERWENAPKELKQERDDALVQANEMYEYANEAHAMIEDWIELFDMQPNDDGDYIFKEDALADADKVVELTKMVDRLSRENSKLADDYNRDVRNSGATPGRPLAASPSQVQRVLRMKKDGKSLRYIATQTNLGLRTVRTIVAKDEGTDRTSMKQKRARKLEVDRLRLADWRLRARQLRDQGKRGSGLLKEGAELQKRAKGIGAK